METNEMDAYSRLAYIINKQAVGEGTWLPGFGHIMRIFSPIPDNGTYLNYRIGIYIFTLLSGFTIYKIVSALTTSFFYSLFGMVFFLFHPLTIQLSVLTLTEPLWIFFVLLTIYFLFIYQKKHHLLLALSFYIISQTIRFESWILIPIITIYLYDSYRRKQSSFFLITSVFIFPIFWFFATYLNVGYIFSFILDKYHCSTNEFSPLHWNIKNIIYDLNIQLSTYIFSKFTILVVLIFGIFQKNKKIAIISFSALYLLFVFIVETYFSLNENTTPRFYYYLVPVVSIIFPYLIYVFIKDSVKKNIFKVIFLLLICLFVYLEFFTLNKTYYSEFTKEAQSIKTIINDLQISKDDIVIFCVPYFDFSTLFSYATDFKVYDCSSKQHLYANFHGVLIADANSSGIYDQEIKWLDKITFQNLYFYKF